MSFFVRHRGLIVTSTLLLAGAVIPWMIWGDALDATFTVEGSRTWIAGFGAAGGLAGASKGPFMVDVSGEAPWKDLRAGA